MTAIEKLLTLAADADRMAAAYRLAAAALNGHADAAPAAQHPTVLDTALALARPVAPSPPPSTRTGDATRATLERRARTARVLALVADHGPLTAPAIVGALADGRVGLAPLVNAGYLTRRGGKFRRTAKPFIVDWRDSVAKQPKRP